MRRPRVPVIRHLGWQRDHRFFVDAFGGIKARGAITCGRPAGLRRVLDPMTIWHRQTPNAVFLHGRRIGCCRTGHLPRGRIHQLHRLANSHLTQRCRLRYSRHFRRRPKPTQHIAGHHILFAGNSRPSGQRRQDQRLPLGSRVCFQAISVLERQCVHFHLGSADTDCVVVFPASSGVAAPINRLPWCPAALCAVIDPSSP